MALIPDVSNYQGQVDWRAVLTSGRAGGICEWARKHRSAARFPRISDDTKAEVVRLRASGLSYAAIAKQLGISQTSAWKAAH